MEDPKPTKKYGYVYVCKPYKMGGNHPWSTKVKVASTYLASGSPTITAKLCEIPEQTLFKWMNQQWWKDLISELMVTEKVETNKRLKKIADKALDAVMDRIVDGNYQYDQKKGKIVRVPVSARDANKISMDLLDKQELLEKRIQSMQSKEEEKTVDSLQKIADSFAKLVKKEIKKTEEIDITDAVITEIKEPENARTS